VSSTVGKAHGGTEAVAGTLNQSISVKDAKTGVGNTVKEAPG
jgi:hypothetical protein